MLFPDAVSVVAGLVLSDEGRGDILPKTKHNLKPSEVSAQMTNPTSISILKLRLRRENYRIHLLGSEITLPLSSYISVHRKVQFPRRLVPAALCTAALFFHLFR